MPCLVEKFGGGKNGIDELIAGTEGGICATNDEDSGTIAKQRGGMAATRGIHGAFGKEIQVKTAEPFRGRQRLGHEGLAVIAAICENELGSASENENSGAK